MLLKEYEQDVDLEFFQEEEGDEDSDLSEDVYSGEFLEDIRTLAKNYIKQFFSTKEMHCGGRIQDRHLLTDRNISTVLNTSIDAAVSRSYLAFEKADCFKADNNGITEDILLVIDIMRSCAKAKIPKEFGGGMLLLYLEFCEGIVA